MITKYCCLIVVFKGNSNIHNQIQPSSIDLTLSEECYEIKSSFLSAKKRLRDKLSDMIINKIDLSKKKIFHKNKTYIVRLNEKLNLNHNISEDFVILKVVQVD